MTLCQNASHVKMSTVKSQPPTNACFVRGSCLGMTTAPASYTENQKNCELWFETSLSIDTKNKLSLDGGKTEIIIFKIKINSINTSISLISG